MRTIILSSVLIALLSGAAVANENYLNQATKLLDVDQAQAFSLLKSNNSKFKTGTEKQRLADWYYTYGRRSEALNIYEEVLALNSNNIDALVSKHMILDQKHPSGKSDSLHVLSTMFEVAKKQKNIRYFNYIGMLAFELKAYDTALSAFEVATMYGDGVDSMFGYGLAIEKIDIAKASVYYQSMLDNEMVPDADRVLVRNRLTYIQNNKGM